MRIFGVFLFAFGICAFADQPEDFKPALSGDQKVQTIRAQDFERDQFNMLSEWKFLQVRVGTKKAERDRLYDDFQRALHLAKDGTVSADELGRRETAYKNGVTEYKRALEQYERAGIQTEIAKHRVLQEGDPDTDYRSQIFELMKLRLESDHKELLAMLQNTRDNRDYFEKRMKNGEYLYGKNAVTLVELEKRRIEYRSAADEVVRVEQQIEAVKNSIVGIEKSIRAVQ